MKKKRTRHRWLWIFLVLVVLAAILLFYYFPMKKGPLETEAPPLKRETPMIQEDAGKAPVEGKIPAREERENEAIGEGQQTEPEDKCRQVENELREFFNYLDNRSYVRHLGEGLNTYHRFKGIIKRLCSQPPIPAGEGIDVQIITKNIFHFFRVLDRNDLRLIKDVLTNEAETLEMNLDMFYTWLMAGDRCSDPEGIRPSLEVLYHYAGFCLNTIGGRAYLFRRPTSLRLLISYYSLLIIHEADKKGINTYGLDIFPHIAPVEKEISIYPDLLFKEEYIQELRRLSKYYLEKR